MENEKYVIACVNGVPPSDSVVDYSAWLSKRTQNTLKLLHTLDHQSVAPSTDLSGSIGLGASDELLEELVTVEHEQNKLLQRKAKLILETAKRRSEAAGNGKVKMCLLHGRLIENLVDLKDKSEIVVIGRYGQSHQNASKGGVGHKVEAVIRALEKPIMVVSQPFVEPSSMMVAYDGSAASQNALSYIQNSKVFSGLQIHVVYVGEKNEESTSMVESAVRKLEGAGLKAECAILSGEADEALLAYMDSNNISMTAMGAFGHHWLRDLLVGSFTSKMLSLSEKPLLLVR